MKALTVSQPYASMIADGNKFVENRVWETHYRGPLAIHAGKGSSYMTAKQIRESDYPFGCVIATCSLDACIYLDWPDERIVKALPAWCSYDEFLHHAHTEGPWCWLLSNVVKIDWVPFKGAQGLWNWSMSPIGDITPRF